MHDSSKSSRGTIQAIDRSSKYLRTRITGYFDGDCCAELIELIDGWRSGRSGVHIFHDCHGLEDYDVEARERISRWCRDQIAYFDGVHVLVERRTVAWGIQVISMVSGLKMSSYHSPSAFEEAFERCRNGR